MPMFRWAARRLLLAIFKKGAFRNYRLWRTCRWALRGEDRFPLPRPVPRPLPRLSTGSEGASNYRSMAAEALTQHPTANVDSRRTSADSAAQKRNVEERRRKVPRTDIVTMNARIEASSNNNGSDVFFEAMDDVPGVQEEKPWPHYHGHHHDLYDSTTSSTATITICHREREPAAVGRCRRNPPQHTPLLLLRVEGLRRTVQPSRVMSKNFGVRYQLVE